MLTRVAVLSDIHGVAPALAAVLAEPEVLCADRIVVTGDTTAGPQPAEVLDMLAELGDRVTVISGNADRAVVEHARTGRGPAGAAAWAASRLPADRIDWLADLPDTVRLPVAGHGDVLFCHGTPRRDDEVVVVDSALGRWAEVFADLDAAVGTVVCGHTHMPFARLAHGRLVVNPGSVGMPYGRSGAHWALLGPGTDLRRTGFDITAAATEIAEACPDPTIARWVEDYILTTASDEEALTHFARPV
ncbi:metallophosphoesterase family protein [Actinokineospora auranticolor]|uniref:Putative phosphoesterase n=1 Tax=Actinokineospora auranticolor TaxID=155976 RepID=A0A2S6GTI9_9PSEU|nr:metallophosphoesterase family protein [Actinokineospora auranticolor]PPK68503.1 putative phosphoesterase [Actinokineospora auranticolor]